jgi:hypothetical protein
MEGKRFLSIVALPAALVLPKLGSIMGTNDFLENPFNAGAMRLSDLYNLWAFPWTYLLLTVGETLIQHQASSSSIAKSPFGASISLVVSFRLQARRDMTKG